MAVAVARHSIAGLGPYLDRTVVQDAELLVSELVTNSLRHGGLSPNDSIEICLRASHEAVMVEVADEGRGFGGRTPYVDAEAPATPDRKSGWGLFLVEHISDRWGVVDSGGGARVWFELRPGASREREPNLTFGAPRAPGTTGDASTLPGGSR